MFVTKLFYLTGDVYLFYDISCSKVFRLLRVITDIHDLSIETTDAGDKKSETY